MSVVETRADSDVVRMVRPAGAADGFAINGRFLTQPVTGVQRYAREVTLALDDILHALGRRARLLVPETLEAAPRYAAIDVVRVGGVAGHLWEQTILPWRARAPLLGLCNTGPLVTGRQVVCIHDANVHLQPDSYGRGFRLLYRALQPALARRSACVATVSHAAARQIADVLPISAASIAVLPNGHEHVLRWDSRRSTLLKADPPKRPFVLMLGSRARHKNMGLLLDLAPALDRAGLDILVAGGGAGVFADIATGGAPNVRWLGRVSDDDLAALMGAALCLAFPSLTEGFGLPALEAMALGCPVVSTDRASLPEICGDAALLAAPDDPAGWFGHLTLLAANDDLRASLIERGHRQAAAFSWRRTAQGYLALVEALAALAAAPSLQRNRPARRL